MNNWNTGYLFAHSTGFVGTHNWAPHLSQSDSKFVCVLSWNKMQWTQKGPVMHPATNRAFWFDVAKNFPNQISRIIGRPQKSDGRRRISYHGGRVLCSRELSCRSAEPAAATAVAAATRSCRPGSDRGHVGTIDGRLPRGLRPARRAEARDAQPTALSESNFHI